MKYAFYPGCSFNSAAGYKESVNAVNRALGIVFETIPDWNCCGATIYPGVDELGTLCIGARVFALANRLGYKEIVTGCNACYTTLRKVSGKLKNNKKYLADVNKRLAKEGLIFDPDSKIRHFLEVLVDDIPENLWKEKITAGFKHIRVAGYYGCQFTRPWGDFESGDMLERLIEKTGFTPVDHSAKTLCCGASLAIPYADESKVLIKRIVKGILDKKADLITTICPLCQFNLDNGQAGLDQMDALLPVTYFTQIAGLALGIAPEKLGLDKLLIRVSKEVKRS